MKSNHTRLALTALAAGMFSATAFAGGPLFLYDAEQPLAWDVSTVASE